MILHKTALVLFLFTLFTLAGILQCWSNWDETSFKFDFGAGKVEP